jgi:hypothetical protein
MRHLVTPHRTADCYVCTADGDTNANRHPYTTNRDANADSHPHTSDSYSHTTDANTLAPHRHSVRFRLRLYHHPGCH